MKLNVFIYIHSTQEYINKHTQFHKKNRRLVVSEFVKLSDDIVISQNRMVEQCLLFFTNVFVSDALRKMLQIF